MTIQEREVYFYEEVFKFEYDIKMLTEFYEYWTEPNKSGTKMKFELEKTWDTKRRLKRWFDNNKKWHGQTNNKPGTSEARLDALKRF